MLSLTIRAAARLPFSVVARAISQSVLVAYRACPCPPCHHLGRPHPNSVVYLIPDEFVSRRMIYPMTELEMRTP